MIANVKNLNGFHKGEIAGRPMTANDALFRFWDELIVDKRAIYVERVNLIGKNFFVDYCHQWLLDSGEPDWMELVVAKCDLVQFVVKTGDNKWNRHFFDGGEIKKELVEMDAEAYLLELETTDLYYLVRNYIESLNLRS